MNKKLVKKSFGIIFYNFSIAFFIIAIIFGIVYFFNNLYNHNRYITVHDNVQNLVVDTFYKAQNIYDSISINSFILIEKAMLDSIEEYRLLVHKYKNLSYISISNASTNINSYIYDVPLSNDILEHIYITSKKYSVEEHYETILALIWLESTWNPSLISSTNDYGLMQINKVNHDWLKVTLNITNFLDPYENIEAGIYMLSSYIHKYGDIHKALMVYNLGEYGASKKWSNGVYSTGYSRNILNDKLPLIKELKVI